MSTDLAYGGDRLPLVKKQPDELHRFRDYPERIRTHRVITLEHRLPWAARSSYRRLSHERSHPTEVSCHGPFLRYLKLSAAPSGALIAVNTDCALPDWSIIMEIDGDQGAVTGHVISGALCSQDPVATTNRKALTAST
jgi:hypothetical protein